MALNTINLKHKPIFYLHSYLTFLFSVGKKWSCEKDVGDSQRKEFTGKSTVHIYVRKEFTGKSIVHK